MTVVEFKPRASSEEHISGEAICVGCKHQWVVVAPTGTVDLECPSCGAFRGVYKYPVVTKEGSEEFVHSCGCKYFQLERIAPEEYGHLRCIGCGGVVEW
jgi:hypothetical protein